MEDLRYVKHGKRGTFPRRVGLKPTPITGGCPIGSMPIPFSCWDGAAKNLGSAGGETTVQWTVVPWKTSQFCRNCGKWDRRSRVGDEFRCVYCGFSENADLNAARNLALLGVAGVYGLRSLQSPLLCSV
ncbi:MAG: zinc ribbon domain-containing protein [bacterium]